jgi:hypothetical protein
MPPKRKVTTTAAVAAKVAKPNADKKRVQKNARKILRERLRDGIGDDGTSSTPPSPTLSSMFSLPMIISTIILPPTMDAKCKMIQQLEKELGYSSSSDDDDNDDDGDGDATSGRKKDQKKK